METVIREVTNRHFMEPMDNRVIEEIKQEIQSLLPDARVHIETDVARETFTLRVQSNQYQCRTTFSMGALEDRMDFHWLPTIDISKYQLVYMTYPADPWDLQWYCLKEREPYTVNDLHILIVNKVFKFTSARDPGELISINRLQMCPCVPILKTFTELWQRDVANFKEEDYGIEIKGRQFGNGVDTIGRDRDFRTMYQWAAPLDTQPGNVMGIAVGANENMTIHNNTVFDVVNTVNEDSNIGIAGTGMRLVNRVNDPVQIDFLEVNGVEEET